MNEVNQLETSIEAAGSNENSENHSTTKQVYCTIPITPR
jgi:hypothetical protein